MYSAGANRGNFPELDNFMLLTYYINRVSDVNCGNVGL